MVRVVGSRAEVFEHLWVPRVNRFESGKVEMQEFRIKLGLGKREGWAAEYGGSS